MEQTFDLYHPYPSIPRKQEKSPLQTTPFPLFYKQQWHLFMVQKGVLIC